MRKEGFSILKWAVCISSDHGALRFLCDPENLDKELLRELLLTNGLKTLEIFLGIESAQERLGQHNKIKAQYQAFKFYFLLKIDADAVTNFMQTHISEQYMTGEIKKNFRAA